MVARLLVVCSFYWYCVWCGIETYRGAVLEHEAFHLYEAIVNISQGQYVVNKNLDIIEESVIKASSESVDIMVLSEVALFGHNHNYSQTFYFFEQFPSPNSGLIACDNKLFTDKPILQRLSCLAKNYNIYLCVHNGDNQPCNETFQNCESRDHYQWSTTIVFNRNGEIIAKYVKMHMVPDETQFNQMSINNTLKYDVVTFNMTTSSSINITFGLIICYDLEYGRPLLSYIEERNISNIIFSTSYPDNPQHGNVLGEMQRHSKTLNVNWLGASTYWFNNISNNTATNLDPWSSGSGIFSSGNILNQYYNTNGKNRGDKLVIADIPININGPNQNIPKLQPYLVLNKQPQTVCQNYSIPVLAKPGLIINDSIQCNYNDINNNINIKFTCNINAKISNQSPNNHDDYWILHASNGYMYRDPNSVYSYTQFCSFYRCFNNNTCSDTYSNIYDTNGTTIFNQLNLNANYIEKSVMYFTIFDNKGYVYKNINDESKVGWNNNNNNNVYFTNNTDNDVIINVLIEGKQYNMEAIL